MCRKQYIPQPQLLKQIDCELQGTSLGEGNWCLVHPGPEVEVGVGVGGVGTGGKVAFCVARKGAGMAGLVCGELVSGCKVK